MVCLLIFIQSFYCCLIILPAFAEEPFVRIDQCERGEDQCVYNVTNDKDKFRLKCSVLGAKPGITQLWWESENPDCVNGTTMTYNMHSDGTVDTIATFDCDLASIGTSGDSSVFTCIANGTAVNGRAAYSMTVSVVSAPVPTGKFLRHKRY